MRLIARRKLKDSKALHQFPTFSDLSDEEVNLLIDQMDHITRFKNDAICHQHDVSDSFYIIVKGSAVVTVDDDTENADDETDTCPEQIEVGRIDVLGFFGEGSLVKDSDGSEGLDGLEGSEGICSATVTVSSDRCELLRLKRKAFLAMNSSMNSTFQAQHEDRKSVLEQLKDVKMERTKNNQALLERRRSHSKQMGMMGGMSGEMGASPKPVSLEEKGVPKLEMGKKGGGGERSLFS